MRAGRDNADLAQLGINDLPLHYVKLKQSVSRQAGCSPLRHICPSDSTLDISLCSLPGLLDAPYVVILASPASSNGRSARSSSARCRPRSN